MLVVKVSILRDALVGCRSYEKCYDYYFSFIQIIIKLYYKTPTEDLFFKIR